MFPGTVHVPKPLTPGVLTAGPSDVEKPEALPERSHAAAPVDAEPPALHPVRTESAVAPCAIGTATPTPVEQPKPGGSATPTELY